MPLNTGTFQIFHGQENLLHPIFVVGVTSHSLECEIANFEIEVDQALTLVFQGPRKPDLAVLATVTVVEEIQRLEPLSTEKSLRLTLEFQQPVSEEMLKYLQSHFYYEKAHVLGPEKIKKEVKKSPLLKWAHKFGFDFTDD